MSKKDWRELEAYRATGMAPEDVQELVKKCERLLDETTETEPCGACALHGGACGMTVGGKPLVRCDGH